jgi:hypothetical protein
MFLPCILKQELLPDRDDTCVLKEFRTSRTITISMVRELETSNASKKMLLTEFHVRWAMEVIGHAFTLPIEDAKDISGALSLYERWLLSEVDRPIPISRDETPFFKDIFCHISLLFLPRGKLPDRELISSHVNLCSKAIDILMKIARRRLHKDSLETLLAVTLGICHQLLSVPYEQGDLTGHIASSIANKLECHLTILVLDVWFRSRTTSPKLWSNFSRLARRWTHRIEFMKNWKISCNMLTQRLIALVALPLSDVSDELEIVWWDRRKARFAGATGSKAGAINGLFVRVDEMYNGHALYRKETDPDIWLRYSPSERWVISYTADKVMNNINCEALSETKRLLHPWTASDWDVGGTRQKLDVIAVEEAGKHKSTCVHDFRDRLVAFFWYQLKNLLGSPVDFVSAEAFKLVVESEDENAELFLKVGDKLRAQHRHAALHRLLGSSLQPASTLHWRPPSVLADLASLRRGLDDSSLTAPSSTFMLDTYGSFFEVLTHWLNSPDGSAGSPNISQTIQRGSVWGGEKEALYRTAGRARAVAAVLRAACHQSGLALSSDYTHMLLGVVEAVLKSTKPGANEVCLIPIYSPNDVDEP